MSEALKKKQIPNSAKFTIAALAGMGATCVVHPFDLIKTRLQVSGEGGKPSEYRGPIHCFQTIVQKEGVMALYNGLSASLLRQATSTGSRLGLYTALNDWYKNKYDQAPGVAVSVSMGVVVGAISALVGCPADVGLTRMMADGFLPPDQRRNYKHVFDALIRIVKDEGVKALFTGGLVTIARATAMSVSQLASYTQVKRYCREKLELPDGFQTHFVSSLTSALIACYVTLPLDIAKTHLQKMKNKEYKGMVDVMMKVVQNEGILKLWKGFTPYFARMGPHVIITFTLLEKMIRWYNKYILHEEKGSSI